MRNKRIRFTEEQKQEHRKIDIESLAKVVFRYLKSNPDLDPDLLGFADSVTTLMRELFPEGNNYQSASDYVNLLEAITLLETRRLVAKDISPPRDNTRYPYPPPHRRFVIYLTSIGVKSCIDDEIILLVDKPEEIVRALEEKTGDLDEVVRQYYLESLRAYQEELYISSVICLGAASERAIHWLAESIESYYKQYQGKIKAKRNMPDLIKYLSDTVIPNIFGAQADKNFADELKKRLNGLGNLYRENRNEAGHPQTVDQSWLGEDQEYLLIQFRRYITTICEAIGRIV